MVQKAISLLIVLLSAGFLPARAEGQGSGALLAPTPPMGWNSWDAYGLTIRESEFKANAQWMAAHLKPFGWEYAVIDGGWYFPLPAGGGRGEPALDGYGRHIPATNRFPSATGNAGFKPLADYTHSLGLKFGLHMMRGIPREVVASNVPIADSPYHAADAAETTDICSWGPENYGVKDNAAGQAYYDSVMKLFASWGLDYLKVDCTSSRPYKSTEIRMISRAIAKSGRPIVLSLSPGPTSLAVADDVRQYAQLWRISNDFWDRWIAGGKDAWSQDLHGQFATAVGWAPHIEPGHWMDADGLPLGYIGPRPGEGPARWTRFTHDEQRTMVTLWSIIRSPLIICADLTRNDPWTTALETNPEVIAVDQHSTRNRPLITSNDITIWAAEPEDGHSHYLAIFNRSDGPLNVDLRWNEVGLEVDKAYQVRDLWERKNLSAATSLKLTLRPHASVLYRLEE